MDNAEARAELIVAEIALDSPEYMPGSHFPHWWFDCVCGRNLGITEQNSTPSFAVVCECGRHYNFVATAVPVITP